MRIPTQDGSPFAKIVAAIGGVILLVLGFMFSLVVLAIAVVAGLGIWGWFWWKTRKLRQALRDNPPPGWDRPAAPDGHVIEGEAVIVEEETTRATRASANRLPGSPDHHSPD